MIATEMIEISKPAAINVRSFSHTPRGAACAGRARVESAPVPLDPGDDAPR